MREKGGFGPCGRAGREPFGHSRGLSRNGVKNYSKGPCVTILE